MVTVAFVQEYRSDKSLAALSDLAPPHCKVLRDGVVADALASDVTIGDVVVIAVGDRIPADVRLTEVAYRRIGMCHGVALCKVVSLGCVDCAGAVARAQASGLQVDDSSLTGETEPVHKNVSYRCPHANTPLAERKVGQGGPAVLDVVVAIGNRCVWSAGATSAMVA